MTHDYSDSKIPPGWLIVYVVVVSLIFWRLFIVDETPLTNVGDRPLTYLNNLFVSNTYLMQEKVLPEEELQAVLGKAISSDNSVRSILVNDYKIAKETIDPYSAAIAHKDSSLQKLIEEEFKKVTEEIKLRLGNIDTWFHYKFVLLGGVFFILAGNLEKAIDFAYPLRPKTQALDIKSKQISEEHKLEGFLNSKVAHCVLGLGCVVALTVDMHIRHELDAIVALGNWVAYFAEPALSGSDFQKQNQGQFLLWENYLRAKDGAGETVLGTALHNMPHLFVLTLLIYILYIWTFQNICARAMGQEKTAVMGTF